MKCIAGEEKEAIRRGILARGFDRIGFAEAGPAPRGEALEAWIARGFAGEMGYIARSLERRLDPRRVLPGARTVVVAAVHYAPPPPGPPPPGAAAIAAYALGPDYHRVLGRRLGAARRELERLGARARSYVDAGPVLEKAWAERAGVGWIGKNACSIDPARGSYFFLGTILTDLPLEPDPPSVYRCGTCRRCLEACPTGALVEPGRLDARLCIAYWTIEHRGEVSESLWAASGSLVFGCDVCQSVCPYNRRAAPGDPELAPLAGNVFPPLSDLARLDSETFRARFRGTPVLRAKPEGFLRSVAIALANSGGADAARALRLLAERPEAAADAALGATVRAALRRLGPG